MAQLKKCIVIPDSYKGTISAANVCSIMKESILKIFPNCEVQTFPATDGGEGTVDCFLSVENAEKREVKTTGPFMEPVTASYAKIGEKAVLEVAQTSGLPQAEGRLNPRKATTYGLGKMIEAAITDGCRDITIGLGGSCTNDAGIGAVQALGARFYNREGNLFSPAADQMTQISRIDLSEVKERLKGIKITAMCDITNPMYGMNGAAWIFAPQKGADEECVKLLDKNLRALDAVIKKDLEVDVAELPGAGAAGALGAGVAAFLGGTLRSGIETVLDLLKFDQVLEGAQLVFTGEGCVDGQSLQGKVLSGVSRRAKKAGVPVVVVAGACKKEADQLYREGVCGVFSTCRTAEDFSVQRLWAGESLASTMEAILQLYRAV